MAKRSRKLLIRRPQRSKSSSRKTMKRTKRQPSKKRTLKKRKSRTKSVRKRKKTKKVMKGGVEPTNEPWYAGEKDRTFAIEELQYSNPGSFMVRKSNNNYVLSYKHDDPKRQVNKYTESVILGSVNSGPYPYGKSTISEVIEHGKANGILDKKTQHSTYLTTPYKEIIFGIPVVEDDDDDYDGIDDYENIPSSKQIVRVEFEPDYISTALRVIPMDYPNTPGASYDPSNNNSESWANISLTNFTWTEKNKSRYNRYIKIGTGDSAPRKLSRVVLGNNSTTIEGYINANFIGDMNGDMTPGNVNAFIAAMAPKFGEKIETSINPTMFRFLKMIMEQKVKVVIMVTGLIEKGKNKCVPYWPGGKSGAKHITREILAGSEPYGKIVGGVFKQEGTEVIFTQQDETAKTYEHYHHSVVKIISKKKKNGARIFTASTPYVFHHFWYKSWPDMGIPKLIPSVFTGITEMIKKARSISREYSTTVGTRAPILVHCSAGIGRTGTIIGIAIGMKLIAQHINTVPGVEIDYKKIINFMRRYRGTMVQTQAQAYYMTKVLQHFAANRNM